MRSTSRGRDLVAAHPVEHEVHADAGAGPLGQRGGELLADVSRPVDVCLESDGALRRADRLEHRGEYLIAVLQGFDAIARDDGGSQQHAHLAPELRVERVVAALDAMLRLLFPACGN
jgi:hypothetical protein